MTIKKTKIPTILGLIILIAATFLGVFFLNSRQIFKLGAVSEATPKDIRISNITDNSFTVSWVTDRESSGFLVWGEEKSQVSRIEEDENQDKTLTHTVTVSGLTPEHTYFFKINSEGVAFDNKGIPWEAVTGPALPPNKNSILISGSVLTSSGTPLKKALVFLNIGGYLLSSPTSENGNFVFQLSQVRSPDLGTYAKIDESQTLLEIFVQAGPQGVATAQVFPQSAKPIPPIILGGVHDFRNLPPSQTGEEPSASLEAPDTGEPQSGFSLPQDLSAPSSTTVTLESLSEGEIVTSTQPEFFGEGPDGTTIEIKVESENPITDQIKVSANGDWKWAVPQTLSEGPHKITITWKDASGILRTLTRTFIVQAGEAPAFEATPSETLKPSPTATPTQTPTPTPEPLEETPTPTVSPPPATGSLTPTIVFTILGIGMISLSFAIWKYSNA